MRYFSYTRSRATEKIRYVSYAQVFKNPCQLSAPLEYLATAQRPSLQYCQLWVQTNSPTCFQPTFYL
jgi:hypothetical protein